RAFAGLLPRPLEHQPDMAFGLTDVLVQQLRALDVEEVTTPLLTGPARDLLGQRARDRLRDQRLPASRGAVQEYALGRLQLVLGEHIGVQVRKLDRIANRFDLAAETADAFVIDIGDLFEDQLLDLGLRYAFEDVTGARIQQQRIA